MNLYLSHSLQSVDRVVNGFKYSAGREKGFNAILLKAADRMLLECKEAQRERDDSQLHLSFHLA